MDQTIMKNNVIAQEGAGTFNMFVIILRQLERNNQYNNQQRENGTRGTRLIITNIPNKEQLLPEKGRMLSEM